MADFIETALGWISAIPGSAGQAKASRTAVFWARLLLDVFRHWAVSDSSASERRAFVRSAFAAQDALISAATSLALFLHDKEIYRLTTDEVTILQEKRADVDARGVVVSRSQFLPFASKLKFLLTLAGRYALPDFKVDLSDSGWQCLQSAIEKRDQLTHPKSSEHLDVDEEDLRQLKSGLEWLGKQLILTICLTIISIIGRHLDKRFPLKDASDDDLLTCLSAIMQDGAPPAVNELTLLKELRDIGGFASPSLIFTVSAGYRDVLFRKFISTDIGENARRLGLLLRSTPN